MSGIHDTQTHSGDASVETTVVRRVRLVVVEGPGAGLVREMGAERLTIGSHEINDLVLDDPTVSRFHCELRIEPAGAVIIDLKSKNGTVVDGVSVREALVRHDSLLQLGRLVIRFELLTDHEPRVVVRARRFGSLVGVSSAMRATLALLKKAAGSDATVLLEGETGTGKEKAAAALHEQGSRADRPFIVVDCGSIPENLMESELFGHEHGAFTGADVRRVGAFEEASGGTLFLDEIGELPLVLQPKLLRALESREIRRVGANRFLPVDIRVIAASNRDLRAEVNAGRFRADLYFRLSVARIVMPALRDRPEDLPALVEELLGQVGASPDAAARLMTPAFLDGLARGAWPGNVRELRNHVERCLLFGGMDQPKTEPRERPAVQLYAEARRIARDLWERRYLEDLMAQFQGKVAAAAEAAGVDRVTLYRLLRRQGLKPQ